MPGNKKGIERKRRMDGDGALTMSDTDPAFSNRAGISCRSFADMLHRVRQAPEPLAGNNAEQF